MDIHLLESIDDCHRMGLIALMPFFDGWRADRKYVAATDPTNREEVVGLLCFKDAATCAPECLGLTYVSVAREHRNKGIATALVQALFTYAKAQGKGVFVSAYEPDGLRYLRKVVRRRARALKVPMAEMSELLLAEPEPADLAP